MSAIHKYPRTRHILDSGSQPGDEDLGRAGFEEIAGRHLVVEEKIDGANAAIGFSTDGRLLLQSRGHYLTGGPRELHFSYLKGWAHGLRDRLWQALGPRYLVYGEWVYAKHTIFYDALPHYFLEFDVLDIATGTFLSTDRRRSLLGGLLIHAVPVLYEGTLPGAADLKALVGPSAYQSPRWQSNLAQDAMVPPHDPGLVQRQTDASGLMEGLYIKIEEDGRVIDRFKYVRPDFVANVIASENHWQSRPILPNRLRKT